MRVIIGAALETTNAHKNAKLNLANLFVAKTLVILQSKIIIVVTNTLAQRNAKMKHAKEPAITILLMYMKSIIADQLNVSINVFFVVITVVLKTTCTIKL